MALANFPEVSLTYAEEASTNSGKNERDVDGVTNDRRDSRESVGLHFEVVEESSGGSIVRWDRDALVAAAQNGRRFTVSRFPADAWKTVELELRSFRISGPDARFVVGRRGLPDRPIAFDPDKILLFRGRVRDRAGSHVFLALGEGISSGYVDLGPGAPRLEVSSMSPSGGRLRAGQVAVFESLGGTGLPPGVPLCGVSSDGPHAPERLGEKFESAVHGAISRGNLGGAGGGQTARAEANGSGPEGIAPGGQDGRSTSTVGLKHLELAVETDYEYFALFGNEIDATAYLFVVYGAVSDIYMRDVNTHIELVFTRVWDNPDDIINGPNPLPEFVNEWQATMGGVARDAAQFFSGRRDFPFGGQAYLSAVCGNFSYGVVGYAVGFMPDPTRPSPFNFDVPVTAHELGHTCGTGHTHDYGIDTCDNPNTTPRRGSIMSYCGQTWSGMNANTDNYFNRISVQPNMENLLGSSSCIAADCNMNNIDDATDIVNFTSLDVNVNGIPDECEDCNGNSILDPLDIAGASDDDNGNGIPDECEADCNGNGIPDDKDIADSTSSDAYGNDIPDECEEDCNGNSTSDYSEIQANMTLDVDRNARLDSCQDCDADLIPDHEELDGAHFLWVASGEATSIIREFFPPTGVLTRSSGTAGGASVSGGQDLIITPDRRVLVSSATDNRVKEFAADGSYIGDLVTSGAGGLSHPAGLIMTAGGMLLVASHNTNEVLAFNGTTGVPQGALVAAGSGGLTGPFGLTFGPNGNLYVTSDTNEVLEFDGSDGSFLSVFVDAADNGGLNEPKGLTFKSDGNLLVASYGTDEVLEFDGTSGAPLGKWAQVGTATAITQDSPWGIRVGPNGHVFVTRTGSEFSSGGGGGHGDRGDTADSHLTDARMFEYHVCTGAWRRTLIGGNDHGLDFATGFDFMPGVAIDCNQNQIQDDCDVASGFSADGNTNGVPDECEIDCNGNGTLVDQFDLIPFGTSRDCNCNFVPDECDITSSLSHDCDSNGVPDECEDCNGNGFADACDISGGSSGDCNGNTIPDDCESLVDCDNNGEADICDLAVGTHSDCNGNGVPDLCDTSGGGQMLDIDFESGLPAGWTTSGAFHVTGSCPVNPPCNGAAWAYAGSDGTCRYGNNQTSELTSPPILLPATTAMLTFCSVVDTEEDFDFAEVFVNGDLLWQKSGGPRLWESPSLDLTAYGGQLISITFRLSSDTSVTGFGWQIDQVGLLSGSEDCNGNSVPDECEVAGGGDVNGNGIPDECEVGSPQGATYPHNRRKNRYISFDPNKTTNDGFDIAFSVELTQLTLGSCTGNGGFCRADRGPDDCKTCSADGNACIQHAIDCAPTPPQSCDPSGETCVNDAPDVGGSNVGRVWWAGPESPLGNGVHLMVSEPFRKISGDWPNPTHVGDCEIVPEAVYGVRAVDSASGAASAALLVETTLYAPISASWWADCVGPLKRFCDGDIRTPQCSVDGDCTAPATCNPAWTLPDGAVNFDDIGAVLALVAPGPGSVSPDMTWVDLHGNASGTTGSQNFDPPNFVANFSDVGQIIFGFQGRPYTFHDPADCPDSGVWP